jgi:hypothetical protein
MGKAVSMKISPLVLAIALLAPGASARAKSLPVPVSRPPHWASHIVFQSLGCKFPRKSFGRIVNYIATSPDGSQETAPSGPIDKHLRPCLPPPDDAEAYRALQVRKFSAARALLLHHGVPFEPNDLLDNDWSPRLVAALASMPEMHKEVRTSHLKGVILADTLYLTPQFSINATTVVVANHIVIEGKRQQLFDNRKSYYIFSATPAVAIGESLNQALRHGGVRPVPGQRQPPPFSVIAGFKLPLNGWRLNIDDNAAFFPVVFP